MGGVFAVPNGVFKQIGHDLLNEDRIHRHDEQLIRHSHRYLDVGIVLAEFAGDLAEHLLGGLRLLGDPGVLAMRVMDSRFSTTRTSHCASSRTSSSS